MPVTFASITSAAAKIAAAGLRTPAIEAVQLSALSGAKVALKLENLQPTGSFKVRGALMKLESLDQRTREQGVIAMSAGNHAQGLAYHARRLKIPATIVMPLDTPFTKIIHTQNLGAKVVLEGETLAESQIHADKLAHSLNLAFVHPYDDPLIMAGQGTIAIEFLEQFSNLDCLIVPIGGGGLIAGIAVAARELKPDIEIIGVEAERYPSMKSEIDGNRRECGGVTVAEGIAVKNPGEMTRKIVEELVDDIQLVSEENLEKAMQIYVREQKLVVEGAGAASLAALLGDRERYSGRHVGLIVSGGNADARLLSTVLLRGLVHDGRLVRLRVEIDDAPGALSNLTEVIGACGGNIIEVVHQRLFFDVPIKSTEVDIALETRDSAHVRDVVRALQKAGHPTRLLGGAAEET